MRLNFFALSLPLFMSLFLSLNASAAAKSQPGKKATPVPTLTPAPSSSPVSSEEKTTAPQDSTAEDREAGTEEANEVQNAGQRTKEKVNASIEKLSRVMGESQRRRSDSTYIVMGDYAPLDLLIPSKFGLTAGIIPSENSTIELELLRASLSIPFVVQDLGEFTDMRISLLARSFLGTNSFNVHYGLSYFTMDMHIGNDILARATTAAASVDLVSTKAIGLVAGIGNRWTLGKNITVGIDWFSWAQPLYLTQKNSDILNYVTNENDKHNIEKAINISAYFPRFSLLKAQIGMSF